MNVDNNKRQIFAGETACLNIAAIISATMAQTTQETFTACITLLDYFPNPSSKSVKDGNSTLYVDFAGLGYNFLGKTG